MLEDHSISLVKLWQKKVLGTNEFIAFSTKGNIGIPFNEEGIEIVDIRGRTVSFYKTSYQPTTASHCCGRFGFSGVETPVFIYDEKADEWEEFRIDILYRGYVAVAYDGFLVGKWRLAKFDFDGSRVWISPFKFAETAPAIKGSYVYAGFVRRTPDKYSNLVVLDLNTGESLNSITLGERIACIKVCSSFLAVGTSHSVYLFDISNPAEPVRIWRVSGFARECRDNVCWGAHSVAFSPDCRYLAIAAYEDRKVVILETGFGAKVFEKSFDKKPISLDWWKNFLAVEFESWRLVLFGVEGYLPSISGIRSRIKKIDVFESRQYEVD